MKIAVLGSAGQLGRELCTRLPGEVLAWTRADLDLQSPTQVLALLRETKPTVVINCAAYNLVDKAETEPATAFEVNAWGVKALAEACATLGILLVHFSTDYVFGLDTSRQSSYPESACPGPISAYGLSKLTGEYWVRLACPKHLVIRTCGLFGRWGTGGKGGNFVETMLRLSTQGKPIRVVHDQHCTPSSASDIAQSTVALLHEGRTGLVHRTNSGSCTWFEFASTIFKLSGSTVSLQPITSQDFGAPARRPGYSVLTSESLPPLRPWQDALADYLHQRNERNR